MVCGLNILTICESCEWTFDICCFLPHLVKLLMKFFMILLPRIRIKSLSCPQAFIFREEKTWISFRLGFLQSETRIKDFSRNLKVSLLVA
jgi:hypothetical protein